MGATQAGLALNPYVLTFMAVSSLAGARVGGGFKPYLIAGSVIAVLGFAQNLVVLAQNAAPPRIWPPPPRPRCPSAGWDSRSAWRSSATSWPGSSRAAPRARSPEATAAAIPDVLFWGAPAAVVLVALMVLLPSPRG
ncbi:hypothetical protein [Nonomuraea angiospora]|uniref:hypothetical protein n=1 Tax=Nonomuraea angiospora TaxID=46172 RepID=UPI0029BEBF13|nr:hypothetical protein [Nonomuraea angiospora]MDX3110210.1 hypothetical protein [Nonomuraea angiospora]